jgi:DNA-binding NtrC family response regulator
MSASVLIIDDDVSVTASLTLLLKQAGYRSRAAATPEAALRELADGGIDLILQDMNFSRKTSGEEGLTLLQEIKSQRPETPVILITAWGSIALAVKGMQSGASDFITKPWTNEQLLQSIRTNLSLAAASGTKGPAPTREELDTRYDFSAIIGNDPKLLSILEIIGRVSPTDASVLITGESGTGKELIAEAIHRNSLRKEGPFVKVNMGGISATLFESEMFGHVKGAYTDAKQERKGRFEMADGGTIFLDEIGDLDPSSQVKLLRVLHDRTYEVLGSSTPRTVDVRVISATNTGLSEAISRGTFREDLLYRLNLIAVHLPPLRERRDDIPFLANYFLENVKSVYRRPGVAISPAAMKWLKGRPWPGNIREFRQVIERTLLMTSGELLDIDHFASSVTMRAEKEKNVLPEVGTMTLDEIERAMITKSMEYYGGNVSRVAEALGLSRAALYRRFERFGIKM